ncbi:MAG TPA: hypothetical protein VH637_02730 [Streptosporangiaceae bacterium]
MTEQAALRRLWQAAGSSVAHADVRPAGPRPQAPPALARTLAGRRSVREFASRPVPVDLLEFACQAGIEAERATWPTPQHGDCGIGIAVAGWDVTGLPRGIFRYLPADRRFVPVAGDGLRSDLRSSYASSPALLLIHGSLDKARARSPQHGYQRLLVRAGTLGYAAMLAALSTGLSGCLFGRASSSISRSLRTGDDRLAHLFTAAIGWPPGGDGQS